MSEGERWAVVETDRRYEVSDCGRVRSVKTRRVLKPWLAGRGYPCVVFGLRGRKHYVHRLVAATFVSNSRGCDQVNHKDGDRTNNFAVNLEWVTGSENQWHRTHVLGKRAGQFVCRQ